LRGCGIATCAEQGWWSKHGGRGFTLVELLVVISIMSLLVAILMPALASARSGAREVACRSNVRQLLLANIGYASENDGYYVAAASDIWEDGGGLRRWHGVRDGLDEAFEALRGPLAGYLSGGAVKECPERVGFVKGEAWAESFEKGCGGYGYNMVYIGSRLWQKGLRGADWLRQAYSRGARVTEVGKPGETVMFADTAMSLDGVGYIEYSFAEPPFSVCGGEVMEGFYMSPSIHFRHRGRATIGWADGSAGGRMMGRFEGVSVYGVNSAEMGLGWFEPIDNTPFDLK